MNLVTQISWYLRGENGSVLVKVQDTGTAMLNAYLARDVAEEEGIVLEGCVIAYGVLDQDERLYNRWLTVDDAQLAC